VVDTDRLEDEGAAGHQRLEASGRLEENTELLVGASKRGTPLPVRRFPCGRS